MTLTVGDLDNGERDLKTVSAVSNSQDPDSGAPIDTYQTRKGETINTLRRQLTLLGWQSPIPYAGSISFTANDGTKTVERSSSPEGWFAPKAAELPFTTSGTWVGDDENKFYKLNANDLSQISGVQSGSARPDMNAYLEGKEQPDYTDMIAWHAVTPYQNNDVVYITNEGVAGEFVILNSPAHGEISIRGVVVVLDANTLAVRRFVGVPCVTWWRAKGDNFTNNQTAFEEAFLFSNRLYVPDGVYILDTLDLPDGALLVGDGIQKTVLKNSGAFKPAVPADPSVAAVEQQYKSFVRTANYGTYQSGDSYSDITVRGITFDWDNKGAGASGAVALWITNTNGFTVESCSFVDLMPVDYIQGRAAGLLITYCKDGEIVSNKFEDEAGYEELGLRYSNKNITITKNLFAGKGTWRHNIEVAAATDLSTNSSIPFDIRIIDNEFRLHGEKQDLISLHRCGNSIISDNSFIVMDDLVDTSESGLRCLVKKFDSNVGGCIISDNTFDFLDTPKTVKRAFEAVRMWATDMKVQDNLIIGNLDGFDDSIESQANHPLIGTALNHGTSYANCSVSGNTIEIRDYNAGNTMAMIKCTGQCWTINDNEITFVNRITVPSDTDGPVFIDVDGTPGGGGFSRAQTVSVKSNISFTGGANNYGKGVYIHGAEANWYIVKDNVLTGARTRVDDAASGTNSIVSDNL